MGIKNSKGSGLEPLLSYVGRTMVESPRKMLETIDITDLSTSYEKITAALRILRGLVAATFYIAIFLPLYLLVTVDGDGASAAGTVAAVAIMMSVMGGGLLLCFIAYRKLLAGSVAWSWGLIVVCSLIILIVLVSSLVQGVRFGWQFGGAPLLVIVSGFLGVYVPMLIMGGAFALLKISKVSEGYLVKRPPKDLIKDIWLSIGLPELLRPHSVAIRGALVLGIAAFLIEGMVFYAYFGLNERVLKMAETSSQHDYTFAHSFGWLIGLHGLFPFVIFAHLIFTLVSQMRKKARLLLMLDAKQQMNEDPRPCVLFLRSFSDDQISLENVKPPWYLRVLDPGSINSNLEELVVKTYSDIGPVIAIGRPTDEIPPLGAARHYLEGEDWQSTVRSLIREASVIIVGIGPSSEGLDWEINTIATEGQIDKTLFVVPPAFNKNLDKLSELGSQIDVSLANLDRPKLAFVGEVHILAFTVESNVSWSIESRCRATELEYEIALRWFFENVAKRLLGASVQQKG